MPLNLSNLQPARGSKRTSVRVGRGGKRGSYSGRGMKGQRARSGGKSGLKALGLKQMIQRLPKKRGFKSWQKKIAVVNLGDLSAKFGAGEEITLKKVIQAGLINKKDRGYKVLAQGDQSKKFTIIADGFSAAAKTAIEAASGRAEVKKVIKS